ncbi:MAG TPA: lysozyme inhibitor LprI family protein [Sphingobium sp.]|uniref:lysozyme inhibitor LprI family protein n=1 Tax=Sphingobium sp. TaxID=1912891 RepID=UPI002ED3C93D
MTQLDMNLCARRDYEASDRLLNVQWTKAVALMKARDNDAGAQTDRRPTYSAALLTSQRAWLAFRDAQCRIEGYSMRGGSAEPMTISGCLTQLTKARIQQLKDLEQGY